MTGSAPKLLVLDQGVPRDAATRLRGLGYECTHVGEIGMGKAADDEILAWSLGKNRSLGKNPIVGQEWRGHIGVAARRLRDGPRAKAENSAMFPPNVKYLEGDSRSSETATLGIAAGH